MPAQLMPLVILAFAAAMIASVRSLRSALAGRRVRREVAEAAEYARITGWIAKIRPEDAGPAITRDKHGRVDLFKGLRRYAPGGRRTRRSRGI